MTDPPAGIPGFVAAPCLGCGKQVEENVAHLNVGGTRDGAYLIEMDSVTSRARATNGGGAPPPGLDLFLLGVAHRDCGDLARTRVELGLVTLADELPTLETD